MLRETPLPKSPTCLTNEQVEAWMRANPDRVQRLDSTVYNSDACIDINANPKHRKRVKRLDNKSIQDALTKQQRKSGKVEISFGKKAKNSAKAAAKSKKAADKPLNRLQMLAKRRNDWLQHLRSIDRPMSGPEVRAMFGITYPKITANRINQDGDYISITKEIYKSRKTLMFRSIKQDKS